VCHRFQSINNVNRNTTIILVTGIIIGATSGWLVKPVTPAAAVSKFAGPKTTLPTRDDTAKREKSRAAARWVARMEKEGVRGVTKEIPPGDIRSVMEEMMASTWGGMSEKQAAQLVLLMEIWEEQDAKGALAWARRLDVPQHRGIALAGVAAGIGKKDPMAGFEIYTEVGVADVPIHSDSLSRMMFDVHRQAAAKGADALLEVARRTPENKTGMLEGIRMGYPEGFDFAKLLDGLAALEAAGGGGGRVLRTFVPSGALGKWGLRDPDAAFDYALSRTAEGQRVRLDDVDYEMSRESSTSDAVRWMGEKLASLEPSQLATLLPGSGLLDNEGRLRSYIRIMPEADARELRYQAIKATPSVIEILQDVPEMEDRLAVIERLRGVEEPEYIRNAMKQWEVSQERIDRVIETVTRPAE
jgi:hypothetical protein